MEDLRKKTLAFCMNPYSSLKAWNDNGTLQKEIRLYNRLAEEFDHIFIFSYGDNQDLSFAEKLHPKISIFPKPKYFPPILYELFLPFLHWHRFKASSLLKTNQNAGSLAPSIWKLLHPKTKFVVRSGYIGSEFARLSHMSLFAHLYFWFVENVSYHLCDHVFIPETDKETLLKKYPFIKNKLTVISNGIDTNIFCKIDTEKEYDIVYPARLDTVQKNHRALLDAVDGLNFKLLFIGKGSEKESLERLARERGISLDIRERVPNEDLPGILASARICAFPSLFEGNPKALLECMSCELPIVAFDVPGVGNLLHHEHSGLLSQPDMASLRKNILRLLSDNPLRIQCGQNARQTILDRYAFDTMLSRERSAYDTLLKKRVLLFQKNLRKPVKQFGEFFKKLEFVHLYPQIKDATTYKNLPSFEQETHRRKDGVINRIRRILGIPNIWPFFSKKGDLILSYGYLLFTNKPYCVYVENGLALFAYDRNIANHPLSRTIFSLLATKKNLKKIIFMTETAKKSFFATIHLSPKTKKVLEMKTTFCYPAIQTTSNGIIKKTSQAPRFLFAGLFYMKGGVELVRAFSRIIQKYPEAHLTIITAKHILQKTDLEKIASVPQITLLDAIFSDQEMDEIYRMHDVFLLPTFRDSLGVVLIEALSFGMPLIINNHYATGELAQDGYNGFVNQDHPMKDYNSNTYEMYGRFFNPENFYAKLFKFQKEGKTKNVENFIFTSMEKFIRNPTLVETFSQNSLKLYHEKFDAKLCAKKMETLLSEQISS